MLTNQHPAKNRGFARTGTLELFQEKKGQFHFQEEQRIPLNCTKVGEKKRKGKRRPEIEGAEKGFRVSVLLNDHNLHCLPVNA